MKYKNKSFKLNKETIKNLERIKEKEGKTWNMIFLNLIKLYNKSNMKIINNKVILKEYDECPYCKQGIIRKKISKFGEFLACDNFPYCAVTQDIKENDIGMAGFKELK